MRLDTIDVQIMFRGFAALSDRESGLKSTDLYLTYYSSLSERAWSPTSIAVIATGEAACTAVFAGRRGMPPCVCLSGCVDLGQLSKSRLVTHCPYSPCEIVRVHARSLQLADQPLEYLDEAGRSAKGA